MSTTVSDGSHPARIDHLRRLEGAPDPAMAETKGAGRRASTSGACSCHGLVRTPETRRVEVEVEVEVTTVIVRAAAALDRGQDQGAPRRRP